MIIYKDKLISYSEDKPIQIWDLRGDITLFKSLKPSNLLTYAIVYKDKLISSTLTGDIEIWDIEGQDTTPIKT